MLADVNRLAKLQFQAIEVDLFALGARLWKKTQQLTPLLLSNVGGTQIKFFAGSSDFVGHQVVESLFVLVGNELLH